MSRPLSVELAQAWWLQRVHRNRGNGDHSQFEQAFAILSCLSRGVGGTLDPGDQAGMIRVREKGV